jgi:hypothetical protein
MSRIVLLSACFLVAAHAQAQAQPSPQPLAPPEYGIKEDEPRVGTRIKRQVVSAGRIPINRRWHELTPEEQAIVRSAYETMAAGDEPPFPADGLKPLLDAIRQAERHLLVAGKLLLVATVDSKGEAQTVKVLASPDNAMTQFVAKVLIATKFKPAVCGGQPCCMDYLVELQFRLGRR